MKKWIMAIAMVVVSALAMATSLTDGLVGYWPFDGDAKDYSGNGNHGTTHGVSLASDRRGNASSAYHFDGSDYISVPASSSLDNISSAITVGAWIKPTAWDNHKENGGNLPAWIPVLQKGNESRVQFQFMHARDGATTWVRIDGSQGGSIENATMPTLGVWQFVALTLDSGYLKYYRNGSLSDSQYVGVTLNQDNDTLFIGVDPWVIWEYFTGNIDEVIIYNRALSSSEILALYNGGLKVCKIAFDVNGGAGSMNELQTLSGKMTTLPVNKFTREGYLFLGWALAPDGEVVYRDGEEIDVDSDKTLYAVWANPALTLTAESADWSSGSITLRCEDADTSGATHTYSLEYLDENNTWVAVGGADAANVAASADGFAHLTDDGFCSRLDGIKTVSYRVKDENGRVSEPCVTRNRHGIFVGLKTFGPDYPNVNELPDAPAQAKEMRDLACGQEGFSDFHLLVNSGARYADVNQAFNTVAENVKDKPGDICIVYFSTHGGLYKDSTVGSLVLYDKPPVADDPNRKGYHEGLLAKHIRSLDPQCKGVAVVCIISACHSGAFFDDSNEEMCRPLNSWCHKEDLGDNVAWITAANAFSSSIGLFDTLMIEYGWKHGWARKNSTQIGKAISFYDLGRYAIAMYNPIVQKLGLSGGDKRKDDVLRKIVAGIIDNEPNLSLAAPSSPLDVQATKDKSDCVTVTWQKGSGGQPDGFFVLRNRKDSDEYVGFEPASRSETSKDLPDTASQEHPMKYAVAAYNGAGVAVSEGFAEGWRTIDVYRATFYFNPPGYTLTPDKYVTPFIPSGESLTAEMRSITEKASEIKLAGLEFLGWKAKETDAQWVVQRHNDNWMYPDIVVTKDLEFHAVWATERTYGMTQEWLSGHRTYLSAANGDIATAAAMPAANGCRTVGECYALGIDPEDPNDDLRITQFKMTDGKLELTLSHTEDGSGNSFLPRTRTLGAKSLDVLTQWDDVTDVADITAEGYRFFKVKVELP